MTKEKIITVIIKEPHQRPIIKQIENSLHTLNKIVGGYIEYVAMTDTIGFFCNEEGKLMELEPNFQLMSGDIVCGTCIFFRNGEDGETEGLNIHDVKLVQNWFR